MYGNQQLAHVARKLLESSALGEDLDGHPQTLALVDPAA
jgi:hypothetical protein